MAAGWKLLEKRGKSERRNAHFEGAAFARGTSFQGYGAAVQLDQLLHQRQPDAQTVLLDLP